MFQTGRQIAFIAKQGSWNHRDQVSIVSIQEIAAIIIIIKLEHITLDKGQDRQIVRAPGQCAKTHLANM